MLYVGFSQKEEERGGEKVLTAISVGSALYVTKNNLKPATVRIYQ